MSLARVRSIRLKHWPFLLLPLLITIYYFQSNSTFPQLPILTERDRDWPPNLDSPLCNLKLYIYEIPLSLQLTQKQSQQCRWSSYSSELILHSLLHALPTSTAQHLSITKNIHEADYYYIPLHASCYLFNCWVNNGWNQQERCGVDENYILPILNFIESKDYFNNTRNHIIPQPMDHSDTYYKVSTRRIMRKAIYLVTNGDLRPPPYSNYFRNGIDIVIPSSTPLLNSYYINPMDYLNEEGHPLKIVRGHAKEWLEGRVVPTELQPKKVEIFETTPSNLFSSSFATEIQKVKPRSIKAIFRGSPSNEKGEAYSLRVRDLFFPTANHRGFSSLPDFSIRPTTEIQEAYAMDLSIAQFGLVPPGYTLDTTRIYEYLAFGVIPIFLGTGNRGGQVLPFEKFFDYDAFSITIPRDRVHSLPEILNSVSKEERERLRKAVWQMGRLLVLEETQGNVIKWIARELCSKLLAARFA